MMTDDVLIQLATQLLEELTSRDWKIVTVESCTGGLVSAILTDVPGCSHAFERGLITYSNEAKQELARVSPALIEEFGPVSAPVAVAMATGGLDASKAHLSVALTGYADDSKDNDQAGMVYIAVATVDGSAQSRAFQFDTERRDRTRYAAAYEAMRMALDVMAPHKA